jgi:hypothetical protein
MIAFDLETYKIQPGLLAPPLVCGSRADEKDSRLLSKEDACKDFDALIKSNLEIAGANFVYDLGVMAADNPHRTKAIFDKIERGEIFDTHLAEALHDISTGDLFKDPETQRPFSSYSLEMIVKRRLGLDISAEKRGENAWRLRYGELDGIPPEEWPEEAREYPKHDARHTYDVAADQKRKCANLHDMKRQVKKSWALHLSAIWGMRTDPILTSKLKASVQAATADAHKRFEAAGIYRAGINPETGRPWPASKLGTKDTKRLAELITEAYQGKPPLTETRRVSTSRDTLMESGSELLEELGKTGPDDKIETTYIPVLERGTAVPINPRINPLVASGRTSYRDPNLQNLPRDERVRNCFKFRPGYIGCSVDIAQGELCAFGQCNIWRFKYSDIATAINAGKDLHCMFGARILNTTYDEFVARKKEKRFKLIRQLAKIWNFGKLAAMGVPIMILNARKEGTRFCEAYGVSADCSLNPRTTVFVKNQWSQPRDISPTCVKCLEVGLEIDRLFFEQWPEFTEHYDWVTGMLDNNMYAQLTQFVSQRVRGGLDFKAGANTLIQGLLADAMVDALHAFQKEAHTDRDSMLWGSHLNVFPHDELIAELPDYKAYLAGPRMAECILEAIRPYFPDISGLKAEPALERRWFKGAETVCSKKTKQLKVWWPVGDNCFPLEDKHEHDNCVCWKEESDREVMLMDLAA